MNKPTDEPTNEQRRQLLGAGALAGVAALVPAASAQVAAAAAAPAAKGSGKPGDFNFLAGEWKISNRRPRAGKPGEWDEFPGEATCWSILGGVGSIEELRIPARNFSGMGLRLLDVEAGVWSDFWVNARSGVLSTPGQTGNFENGAGVFTADDVDDGKPIKVRGVWDRITPNSCRWRQGVSRDNGQTWTEDWFMDWMRA